MLLDCWMQSSFHLKNSTDIIQRPQGRRPGASLKAADCAGEELRQKMGSEQLLPQKEPGERASRIWLPGRLLRMKPLRLSTYLFQAGPCRRDSVVGEKTGNTCFRQTDRETFVFEQYVSSPYPREIALERGRPRFKSYCFHRISV